MSLGGGDRTTTNNGTTTTGGTTQRNPWAPGLDELLASLKGLKDANTAAGPALTDAMQGGIDTATKLYGGAPNLNLNDVTGSLGKILNGGGVGGITAGQEGGASSALARMLSGTPDYAGLTGAIDAANAPILRQFNEQILPGLNTKATFLNNGTGGIKTLNSVLPDIGQRMSENAAGLTNAERLRALSDQTTGLGIFGNLQGQANSQALSAAGLFPELSKLGMIPDDLKTQLAGLPLDLAKGYSSSVLPYANIGGTATDSQTATTSSSSSQKAPNGGLGEILGNGLTLASLFGGKVPGGISGITDLFGGGDLSPVDISSTLAKYGSGALGGGASALGTGLGGLGAAAPFALPSVGFGGGAAAGASSLGGMGLFGGGSAASGIGASAGGLGGAAALGGDAAATGATAAGAGAGAGGFGSAALAAAPWVAAALGVGAVVANNVAKSSPLNDSFDPGSATFTKGAHFDNTKWSAQELNQFLGPALKVFSQTGNAQQALAAIPQPTNERETKLLKGGIKSLFGGTGNPFRVIAKAKGYGEGIWTAGNKDKEAAIKQYS